MIQICFQKLIYKTIVKKSSTYIYACQLQRMLVLQIKLKGTKFYGNRSVYICINESNAN